MSFSDHNHFHGQIVMLEFWIVLNEAFCRTENYFLVNFMNLVPIAVPGRMSRSKFGDNHSNSIF